MQIFATDPCPHACAIVLDNLRLNKMVLESAQMLNTALFTNNTQNVPLKPAWKNHPLTQWVAKSHGNYLWLFEHLGSLLEEFTIRRKKDHLYNKHYEFFYRGIEHIQSGPQTEFINCTSFKNIPDVHEAYKECLRNKWKLDKRKPNWGNRGKPEWA